MKFQENWGILFCVLLLEVQQRPFSARTQSLGGEGDEIITILRALLF